MGDAMAGTDGRGEGAFSARYGWYAVIVLTIANLFSTIDRYILNLLVDPIKRDLSLTDTQIALIQGVAFGLFYTTLGVPISRIADATSRKNVIAAGVTFWSFMTALCGMAQNFWHLFLARIGVGAGESILNPVGYSYISDCVGKEKTSQAIGFYTMGAFLGGGLALIVGGTVVGLANQAGGVTLPFLGHLEAWQLAFLCVGPPGLIVGFLVYRLKEPTRRGLLRRAGTTAEAPKSIPIAEIGEFLWQRRRLFLCLIFGFALLAVFSYGKSAWGPTFFIRTYGWSEAEAGVRLGFVTLLFGPAGALFAGWLSGRCTERGMRDANMRLAMWGSVLILPCGLVTALAGHQWLSLAFFAPMTFFSSFPYPLAAAALQLIAPNQMRSQISAVYLMVVGLLGVGGGPLMVALLTDYVFRSEAMVGPALATVCALTTPTAGLLLFLGLKSYRRALEGEPGTNRAGQAV
jgi:MFS family permease